MILLFLKPIKILQMWRHHSKSHSDDLGASIYNSVKTLQIQVSGSIDDCWWSEVNSAQFNELRKSWKK